MTRICLVDDDILVRDALAIGLRDLGYEVLTAPGAAAGLDLIVRREIGALVTDINMPGAGGAQLIAEVRARWPDLPIIAISADPAIEGRPLLQAARELGADEAMVKPFAARRLGDVLTRLIMRRTFAR